MPPGARRFKWAGTGIALHNERWRAASHWGHRASSRLLPVWIKRRKRWFSQLRKL